MRDPVQLNPKVMTAVEQLNNRVTLGEVAAQSGLDLAVAKQSLLGLVSDTGGHLQVSETGELIYLLPKGFRDILRQKYWRLRLQAGWQRVWRILFYLIRISFGIVLIGLIVATVIAIIVVVTSANSDRQSNGSGNRRGSGLSMFYWFSPDIFRIFRPGYRTTGHRGDRPHQMNFLEAVFSFLFGDGHPNPNLEERRWQLIASTIRQHKGAVVVEQLAPYLDDQRNTVGHYDDDTVLPVLVRYDGTPIVSPTADLVYQFPELQISAEHRNDATAVPYLEEEVWKFSEADPGQLALAGGLGVLLLVLAIVLWISASQIGGVALGLAVVSLVYSVSYLTIPALRFLWIRSQNSRIRSRNQRREALAQSLQQENSELQQKIRFAQRFAMDKVITSQELIYTTEETVLDQALDAKEWHGRLQSSTPENPKA